jgi:hypothetical protein
MMKNRHLRAGLLAVILALAGPAFAEPLKRAKEAIDPDCDVAKAARGAATKAVVGVRGNRCDAKETVSRNVGGNSRAA